MRCLITPFTLLFSFVLSLPAIAQSWTLDPANSSIEISVPLHDGQLFLAHFVRFSADIDFDPANPGAGTVTAHIDTASLTPHDPLDDIVVSETRGADWFHPENFPFAVYESTGFQALGGGRYRAEGTLTIRDLTSPISFDFALQPNGDVMHMQADFTVNRYDLGLGRYSHPNDTTVRHAVAVSVRLEAFQ